MKLHLLGTTGYHPSAMRHTACLMLPEIGICLDAGTGMFRVRDLLATRTLDIFLTHAHLDHCIGLTYLFDVLYEKEVERVRVHAEKEKIHTILHSMLDRQLFPVDLPCEWKELALAPQKIAANGTIQAFKLQHPGGSVGYRLDFPDRSMAYVTDTTARVDADYVEAIRGVDLLVHECNFTDEQIELSELTGHSCLSPVCEVAKVAEVGKLVLVHLNPIADQENPLDMQRARSIFPNTVLGTDEMVLEF